MFDEIRASGSNGLKLIDNGDWIFSFIDSWGTSLLIIGCKVNSLGVQVGAMGMKMKTTSIRATGY